MEPLDLLTEEWKTACFSIFNYMLHTVKCDNRICCIQFCAMSLFFPRRFLLPTISPQVCHNGIEFQVGHFGFLLQALHLIKTIKELFFYGYGSSLCKGGSKGIPCYWKIGHVLIIVHIEFSTDKSVPRSVQSDDEK